jgi:hypothetical protein
MFNLLDIDSVAVYTSVTSNGIPTDDGRNGLVNHSSVTSNGIPTDDGRNGLVNHSSVTSSGIPTDDGRNGFIADIVFNRQMTSIPLISLIGFSAGHG